MTGAPAWAHPAYEPGPAVRALVFLGAEDVPPTDRQWYEFIVHTSIAPLALLACGVVAVALAVLLICRLNAAQHDRAGSRAQFVAMGLVLILSCAAAGLSLQSALRGYARAGNSFRRTADGFRRAEVLLRHAGNVSARMSDEVPSLSSACPLAEELFKRSIGSEGWERVQEFQAGVKGDLEEHSKLVSQARADIEAIPPLLDSIGSRVGGWPAFLVFSFLMPAKVFGVGVFLVLVLVLCRCSFRGQPGEAAEVLVAALGFAILAALMLAAVCGSAAALGLTVASGSFCLDPGVALRDPAQRSLQGDVDAGALRAARSYVVAGAAGGHGPPGDEALRAARRHAQGVATAADQHRKELDLLALVCDDAYRLELRSSLAGMETNTSEAARLVGGAAVYERYRQVVHGSVCGSSLEATALLAFFQAWIGLVVLPLLAAPVLAFLRGDQVHQQPGQHYMIPLESVHSYSNYSRLPESKMVLGSATPAMMSAGPGASLPLAIDPSASVVEGGWMLGNGFASCPPALGSPVMSLAANPMHTGPMQDSPIAGFVPRKAERHVHFADERGRSLFGSQASAMSSVRSAPPGPWGSILTI
mmetsp:Transcript_74681/g.230835  ORF Transcript_74681/g.230835 Transcript_74681/m.230835 type:complete len:589 (+) Transcript_74681:75-1841(+)